MPSTFPCCLLLRSPSLDSMSSCSIPWYERSLICQEENVKRSLSFRICSTKIWLYGSLFLGSLCRWQRFCRPRSVKRLIPCSSPGEHQTRMVLPLPLSDFETFPGRNSWIERRNNRHPPDQRRLFFFFLIPFFDRKSQRGEKSTLFTWIGVIYFLYFVIMTVFGFIS